MLHEGGTAKVLGAQLPDTQMSLMTALQRAKSESIPTTRRSPYLATVRISKLHDSVMPLLTTMI